jgi:hypothetical protein
MKKTLHFTDGKKTANIEIQYSEGRLSIVGAVFEGQRLRRDEKNLISAGQCLDECKELIPEKLYGVWERWHLNDMRADCEHQRAEGWAERPIDPTKPTNSYGRHFEGQRMDSWNLLGWVSETEHPEGLLSRPCPTCGYKYGTAWLREEVPADVIEYLETL